MIKKVDPSKQKKEVAIPKVKAERDNYVIGLFGVNRTGKSSVMEEEAVSWRSTRPDIKKNLIVANDPQKRFQNIANMFIDPEDEEWAVRCLELRNALIIADDFKLLNLKNTPVKGLQSLLYYRAEHNIDIMYSFHNPALALNLLTYFTTHYKVFLTHAQEGSFQKKIPNYMLCTAASIQVNEYVRKYGKGRHKNDPEYDGQGFPYVIVDTEKQTLVGMNMEKETSSDFKDYKR